MKKLDQLLIAVTFCFISIFSYAQKNEERTVLKNWISLFDYTGLSIEKIQKLCPNFPDFRSFKKDEDYVAVLQNWTKNFPSEFSALQKMDAYKKQNPSSYYLGLTNGERPLVFESGWIEMIKASGISEVDLKKAAPHFPAVPNTGNVVEDMKNFNEAIDYWIHVYSHEYEAFVNIPAIAKLSPDYNGSYIDVIKLPYYVKGLPSLDFPIRKETGNKSQDDMNFMLDKMSWYFLFKPEMFKETFGFDIILPDFFDVNKFRAGVVRKLEAQKNNEQPAGSDDEFHQNNK